jgi:hypothetical protein
LPSLFEDEGAEIPRVVGRRIVAKGGDQITGASAVVVDGGLTGAPVLHEPAPEGRHQWRLLGFTRFGPFLRDIDSRKMTKEELRTTNRLLSAPTVAVGTPALTKMLSIGIQRPDSSCAECFTLRFGEPSHMGRRAKVGASRLSGVPITAKLVGKPVNVTTRGARAKALEGKWGLEESLQHSVLLLGRGSQGEFPACPSLSGHYSYGEWKQAS